MKVEGLSTVSSTRGPKPVPPLQFVITPSVTPGGSYIFTLSFGTGMFYARANILTQLLIHVKFAS